MARRKLNENEIAEFRARGISAAEHLFQEAGIQAVTMRNVARRLDCSAMAPYRYFENHEALMTALRASVFARFASHLHSAIADTLDPMQRLKHLGRVYVAFALDNPAAYRLMFDLQPPKSHCAELETESSRAFEPLRNAARDAAASSNWQYSAEEFSHLFWAQLHGLVSLHFSNKLNFGSTLEDLVSVLLGTLSGK